MFDREAGGLRGEWGHVFEVIAEQFMWYFPDRVPLIVPRCPPSQIDAHAHQQVFASVSTLWSTSPGSCATSNFQQWFGKVPPILVILIGHVCGGVSNPTSLSASACFVSETAWPKESRARKKGTPSHMWDYCEASYPEHKSELTSHPSLSSAPLFHHGNAMILAPPFCNKMICIYIHLCTRIRNTWLILKPEGWS